MTVLAKYFFSLFVFLVVSAATNHTSSQVPEKDQNNQPYQIVVGSEFDYPPYCIVTPEGNADGFSVELFRAAAKAMFIEVEFVTGTWSEMRQGLEKGNLDALPLVGRTPERESVYDFTFPYLTMHGAIFTRQDQDDISSFTDLEGKKVAVLKDDNAEEFVRRQNLDALIVATTTYDDALNGLSAGEYDAVIIQRLTGLQLINKLNLQNLKIAVPMLSGFSQSFCFAVNEGNDQLLSLLNEGLSIVMADGTFNRLQGKWFGPLEINLGQRYKIVIGGDFNLPPYEFIDEYGQPAGYNVELTKAIARYLEITVDIQLKPWREIRSGLDSGSIDMVQCMFYSEERTQTYDLSQAYTYVSYTVVSGKSFPEVSGIEELKGKSVIVMNGDIMHDEAIKYGLENQLTLVDSQEEAILLLAKGDHDCALVSQIPALYWINKHKLRNLKVHQSSLLYTEASYAVTHNGPYSSILSQFSEALTAIKATGEYRHIYDKWLGVYEKPEFGLFDFLRYAIYIILPILVLLAGSLLWSNTLRNKVAQRTAELEQEIAIRKQTEEELIESEEHIRLILNSAAEAIYGIDMEGNCTFINKSALKMLRYENPEQLLGKNMHRLIHHKHQDGSDFPVEECRIYNAFLNHENAHVADEVLWRSDGTSFPVEYWSYPQRKHAEVVGTVVTFIDITERKKAEEREKQFIAELEQQVNKRTAELLESKKELEEFSYTVSHDLRSPIRAMSGFSSIILDEYSESLHPEVMRMLEIINKNGLYMGDMIDDLLAFIQFNKQELVPVNIDMTALANEVWTGLNHTERKEEIQFTLHPMPGIRGDYRMVSKIWQSLLDNAIKFSAKKSVQIIEAGTITMNEEIIFFVKDNGIGFDMAHSGKLFKVFEHLHNPKDFVGTAASLAIVQRIIHRHGGRIWATSKINEGATFYFTIPNSIAYERP